MRIALLIMMTVCLSISYGQSNGNDALNSRQRSISLVFDQNDFAGRFSVMSQSDESYDYYVIDLTRLNDRFERVYFMNLTYDDNRIVNLDPDLEKGQTWFKVYYTHKEPEITCLFNDLKDKTVEASKKMSPAEKSDWLASHDKFKNVTK
jgi:hypothetical protein